MPANENKLFGCNFTQSTGGDSIFSLADPLATGAKSSANGNGLVSCWIEDNAGRGVYVENGADWSITDCRFESNTAAQVEFAPTTGGITRVNRVTDCNMSSVQSGAVHLVIGTNARGMIVERNKFSTTDTPWTDNGAASRFAGNHTDGGAPAIGDEIDVNSVTMETATATDLTALRLTLTNYANGNGWAEQTISAGAIAWNGQTCIQVDTEGNAGNDNLNTITGGKNGDILVMKSAGHNRTVVIPKSTATIRVPAGGITFDGVFNVAVFINDGFGRWNLISYSNNT